MGIRSDNRMGQLKAEHDVMATFEGDNVVLMQTVWCIVSLECACACH